jgi:hypothetical protein
MQTAASSLVEAQEKSPAETAGLFICEVFYLRSIKSPN